MKPAKQDPRVSERGRAGALTLAIAALLWAGGTRLAAGARVTSRKLLLLR